VPKNIAKDLSANEKAEGKRDHAHFSILDQRNQSDVQKEDGITSKPNASPLKNLK